MKRAISFAIFAAGGFKVHTRIMDGAGDDLHRISFRAIAAEVLEISTSIHEHFVPMKENLIGEWTGEFPNESDTHFSNAQLGGLHLAVVGGESQVAANSGLDAVELEDFAFDLGRLDGFLAQKFDREELRVIWPYVAKCPGKNAGFS